MLSEQVKHEHYNKKKEDVLTSCSCILLNLRYNLHLELLCSLIFIAFLTFVESLRDCAYNC